MDVVVLDVAAILAQMNRDHVGAAKVSFYRSPHRIGLIGSAGLTDGGHVIDVYTQLDHDASVAVF